jgi:hypothetical protein
MLRAHVVESVENSGAVRLVVVQIGQADARVETRVAGAALLALEKRARDVVGVLGGIVEMQAARLVAERVDPDRKDVQRAAGRLGAAGLGLNVQSRLRQLVDADRARRF